MILDDITQAIGHTPLVRLARLQPHGELLAKLEYLQPGGSVKDRAALSMIRAGEASGQLTPGGCIVEASGGNTGVGLALVAAVRGYKCVIVLPDSVAEEKRRILAALNAEIILTPAAADPESDEGFIGRARRISQERGAFATEQFDNPANALAHYQTTGPELLHDAGDTLDALVASVGSQGTLTGTGRYLRERLPGIKVIAVVAEPHSKLDGVSDSLDGDKFQPDEVVMVPDVTAHAMTAELARREGILAGASAGMAVAAALGVMPRLRRVAVIIPDTARNYLSRMPSA